MSARHVALELAPRHFEGLDVDGETPLRLVRSALGDAGKEVSTQAAYLDLAVNEDLVNIVEAFLAAKAKHSNATEQRPTTGLTNRTAVAQATASLVSTSATTANTLALLLSPHGHGLLVAGADKSLSFNAINNKTYAASTNYSSVNAGSPCLALAVSDQTIAAAKMDGSVALFNAHSLQQQSLFKEHSKYASKIAFSPSKQWLVSAGYDWKLVCYKFNEELQMYSPAHSLAFLGAIESLVFLPGCDTVCVGSRNDPNLHFITLDQSTTDEPVRQRRSMNKNGDDWVSFTPMDMAIVANHSEEGSLDSITSWTLAVYSDLPSGKICLYNIASPNDRLSDASPSSTAASAAEPNTIPLPTPVNSTTPSTIVSPSFTLSWIGDCFGVVADAFSRPRCVFMSIGKRLVLAATSDDSKVILYDALSVLTNEEGVAKKVGEVVGHAGIIRALCVEEGTGVDEGGEGGGDEDSNMNSAYLWTGSFDSTIRKWQITLK
ncbi:UNVERIFIED_CONTAM: hypothetical protein HDU68_006038 [Siphonaria sp. JEL0065]|nr:hypothetical protein HDU68_006038 [Siphonaria sp. JEL0065]